MTSMRVTKTVFSVLQDISSARCHALSAVPHKVSVLQSAVCVTA